MGGLAYISYSLGIVVEVTYSVNKRKPEAAAFAQEVVTINKSFLTSRKLPIIMIPIFLRRNVRSLPRHPTGPTRLGTHTPGSGSVVLITILMTVYSGHFRSETLGLFYFRFLLFWSLENNSYN